MIDHATLPVPEVKCDACYTLQVCERRTIENFEIWLCLNPLTCRLQATRTGLYLSNAPRRRNIQWLPGSQARYAT